MEIKKTRSISGLLILLSGIIILAGAIFTYFFILKGVFGRFDNAELVPDAKTVNSYVFGKKPRAALLYSRYTMNILPEKSSWISDNINTWKRFLSLMNVKYDIIYDSDIESDKHMDYDLLVLPGSKSLSDLEIVKIKRYMDSGGNVFATSGTASFSSNGKWRGWQFLNEVFGIKFTKEIADTNRARIHTLRGGLPLTANIPTGYPLKIATWDVPMAVEVLDPRTQQASFWYNYRLEEGLVREEIKESAGITYGTYGEGRFVWMGFEINSVVGIQDDYIYFERLFRNCIKWLGSEPIAYVKEWPGNYSAAAVIMPVISNQPNNIENIFNILSAERVSATFLTDSETAKQNSSLIRRLTRYGNIAAVADIGYLTSVHDSINTLNNYDEQLKELTQSRQDVQNISGKQVKGVQPYYGLYDHNTLLALIKAGYSYILTDSLTDRSVPKNMILEDGRLVIITKTARDDYEIIRDFNLSQPSLQFYTYQEDIDRVLFEGSLYMFKPHTDYQLRPEYAGVTLNVIKELKEKNFWITTPEEVSEWYSLKNNLELRVDRRSSGRIGLRITNPTEEFIDQVVINIEMSVPAEDISISTEIIGVQPAAYTYDKERNLIYLIIKGLKKGESRTYYVDYTKPNV